MVTGVSSDIQNYGSNASYSPLSQLSNIRDIYAQTVNSYDPNKINENVKTSFGATPKEGFMAKHPVISGLGGAGIGLALGLLTKSNPEETLAAMLIGGGMGGMTGRKRWEAKNNKYNVDILTAQAKAQSDAIVQMKTMQELVKNTEELVGHQLAPEYFSRAMVAGGMSQKDANYLIPPVYNKDTYDFLKAGFIGKSNANQVEGNVRAGMNAQNFGTVLSALNGKTLTPEEQKTIEKGKNDLFSSINNNNNALNFADKAGGAGDILTSYNRGVENAQKGERFNKEFGLKEQTLDLNKQKLDLYQLKTQSDLETQSLHREKLSKDIEKIRLQLPQEEIKIINAMSSMKKVKDPKTGKLVETQESLTHKKELSSAFHVLTGIDQTTKKPYTTEEKQMAQEMYIRKYGNDGIKELNTLLKGKKPFTPKSQEELQDLAKQAAARAAGAATINGTYSNSVHKD
jgi:hypothetical protein